MTRLHTRVFLLAFVTLGASFGPAHAKSQKYTFREGDNLWTVARKFDTRVKDIAHLNGLDPKKYVKPGTVIQLPAGARLVGLKPVLPAPPKKNVKGALYTVREGESAWVIARRFQLKTADLLAANGLDEKRFLKPGQRIMIPGVKSLPAKPKTERSERSEPRVVRRAPLKPAAYAEVQRRAALYAQADQNSKKLRVVDRGVRLAVVGRKPNWVKLQLAQGQIVWIPAKLVRVDKPVHLARAPEKPTLAATEIPVEPEPDATTAPTTTEDAQAVKQLEAELKSNAATEPVAATSQVLLAKLSTTESPRKTASANLPTANSKYANHGLKFVGTPYRRGGLSSRGMDCSGLVCRVLKDFGRNAPHNAAALFNTGIPIDKSELRAGDLVFFKNTYRRGVSHVGIYLGSGKFVHASTRGRRVRVTSLNESYYVRHWAGARRVK